MKGIIGLSLILVSGVLASPLDDKIHDFQDPEKLTHTSLFQVESVSLGSIEASKEDVNRESEEILKPARYTNGAKRHSHKRQVLSIQPRPNSLGQWASYPDFDTEDLQDELMSLDGDNGNIEDNGPIQQLETVHHLDTFNPSVYLLSSIVALDQKH